MDPRALTMLMFVRSSFALRFRAAALAALWALAAAATARAAGNGPITLDLHDETGVLPIIEIPANTPVPLAPEAAESITKPPRDASGPILYGVLRQGSPDGALTMAVFTAKDGAERLVIDANDNENLADDDVLRWEGSYGPPANGQPSLPSVHHTINFTCGDHHYPLALYLRRYDRAQATGVTAVGLANGIVVSIDSYRSGELSLDGKSIALALIPTGFTAAGSPFDQPGTALVLDVNGDGHLNGHPFRSNERFRVGSPFIIGTHAFKVASVTCDGRQLSLEPVDPALAQVQHPSRGGPQTGDMAPHFAVTTIDGDTLSLDELRGKVVLLDFWATWCGPCRMEMPYVRQAYNRFHSQGLEIVGVSLDNSDTEVKAFTQMSGMPWPQTVQGRGLPTPIKRDYAVNSIPAAFLIDREGRIAGRNLRGEGLLDAIESLLKIEGGAGDPKRSD
jgi:thiol-disulfide isomerase/thioredoxin